MSSQQDSHRQTNSERVGQSISLTTLCPLPTHGSNSNGFFPIRFDVCGRIRKKMLFRILVLFHCCVLVAAATDFVSIIDYGAVADGAKDCTASINAAIAAAKAQNLTRVYVPPGSQPYVHNSIIEADGVTLFGNGKDSWLHGNNTEASPIKLTGSNSGVSNLRLTSVDQDSMVLLCFQLYS